MPGTRVCAVHAARAGLFCSNHCARCMNSGSLAARAGWMVVTASSGDDAHHGTHFDRGRAPVGEADHVVEKAVFGVPQAAIVHGGGDVGVMFVELDGHVFVVGVHVGQAQRHLQQGRAVDGHPGGAVRLLEDPGTGRRPGTVEQTDVVQAEEAALEDVVALEVLAVDPPGEVDDQLVEGPFQEQRCPAPSLGPAVTFCRCARPSWRPTRAPAGWRR